MIGNIKQRAIKQKLILGTAQHYFEAGFTYYYSTSCLFTYTSGVIWDWFDD